MVKRWVTVQSSNLGIQATEEAKTTHAQTTRNLPSRGKQRGGSGQIQPMQNYKPTEESRIGARRQQRTERKRTHTHKKGYERVLAESKKGTRIIQ